jgi:hypothetical protein
LSPAAHCKGILDHWYESNVLSWGYYYFGGSFGLARSCH